MAGDDKLTLAMKEEALRQSLPLISSALAAAMDNSRHKDGTPETDKQWLRCLHAIAGALEGWPGFDKLPLMEGATKSVK